MHRCRPVTNVLLLALALPAQGAAQGAAAADVDESSSAGVATAVEAVLQAPPAERSAAVHRLIAAGSPALEAVRAARDGADDPDIRRAFEKAATWILAREIVPELERGLESQLVYDGQYAGLERFGAEGVRALLAIVDDSATDLAVRVVACRAIADVGGASAAPALRRLHDDILLPQVLREQIGILLAVFGDTHAVEKELRDHERFARHEDTRVRLSSLQQLSNLHYRIRRYKKAVEYYEEIIAIYRDVLEAQERRDAPEQVLEFLRRELALQYYNAACSNTLHGDIEKAKDYLLRAVRVEPMHYDNMEKDGDLRGLRAHPDYGAFREELGKLFEGQDL